MNAYAVQEISSQTLVIKVVESKIETIQRLRDKYYNVLLRKGNRFTVTKVSSLDKVSLDKALDKLPESRIVPTVLERSGKYSFSKVDKG